MGKRRGKDKSPREDDDIDLTGPSCSHIRKGIDHSFLKKTGEDSNWNTCQDCKDEEHIATEAQSEENGEERESPTIWVCLKCGHRGCGRNSENQHAINHYEKPRSDPHCLVLSMDNWSVWCYICDDDVQYSKTGHLAQLVTNIKKQALSDSSKRTPQRKVRVEESLVEEAQEMKTEKNEEKENKENQKKNDKKDTKKECASKGQKPGAIGDSNTVSVRGFSNLGNTCFFNAVVQNLSQTQLLRQILKKITEEKTSLTIIPAIATDLEPILVQLDHPGSLTLAMYQLLNEIQDSKKGVITPRELFTQVCKKAARFKGFQQQDSQELLRYLLDGMRAEEIKRVSSAILESLKTSEKGIDAELSKKLIKEFEKNGAPKNFVDQVFGGEMTSTVMCQQCKTVSLVTEMFLDLSLPVSDEAYRKNNLKKGAKKAIEVTHDDRNSPVQMTNGSDDIPTGVGSKYQQKKAKKQAKKQAKNQRRQQKMDGKVTLDSLTPEDTTESLEADRSDSEAGDKAENGNQGVVLASKSEPAETDVSEQDQEKPDIDQQSRDEEEEEGSVVDSEPAASSVANRFTALSEDQTTEDGILEEDQKVEQGEAEDGEACKSTEEGSPLAEDLGKLALNDAFIAPEDDEQDMESDVPAEAKEYTVVNQDPEMAFQTLATRTTPEKQECSVQSCLFQFTEVENLTQNNSLLCVRCTKRQPSIKTTEGSKKNVYTDALKQMLISLPPPVLTLHLKRFQQIGYSVCKVNRHVYFPQILDLAPFCSVNCKNVEEGDTQVLYSLYGIVEHSGTMRSGHYTAYVKTRPHCPIYPHNGVTTQDAEPLEGSWFHVSDTSVQPVTESKVQSSQAYLLFYERIS